MKSYAQEAFPHNFTKIKSPYSESPSSSMHGALPCMTTRNPSWRHAGPFYLRKTNIRVQLHTTTRNHWPTRTDVPTTMTRAPVWPPPPPPLPRPSVSPFHSLWDSRKSGGVWKNQICRVSLSHSLLSLFLSLFSPFLLSLLFPFPRPFLITTLPLLRKTTILFPNTFEKKSQIQSLTNPLKNPSRLFADPPRRLLRLLRLRARPPAAVRPKHGPHSSAGQPRFLESLVLRGFAWPEWRVSLTDRQTD